MTCAWRFSSSVSLAQPVMVMMTSSEKDPVRLPTASGVPRPSWEEYFCKMAELVASRAACTRSQVGAVIVASNRVIATGYNGAPAGQLECTEGGCPRGLLSLAECASTQTDPTSGYDNCISAHAEINALLFAGPAARGATLYVTRAPCPWCAKVVAAAGIEKVIVATSRT